MSKNNKADAFIVQKEDGNYDVIPSKILDSYALKVDTDSEGSKGIKDDGFNYAENILEPRYDPNKLIELLDLNTYHEGSVDAVASDVSGLDYKLVPDDEKEEKEANKPEITRFFDGCKPSINKLIYKYVYDFRSVGYGVLEVIREGTSKSKPERFTHIPVHTLRRHVDEVRVKQMIGTKTVWFVIYGKNYDENNKPYDVHAETGEKYPYNSLSPEDRANELIWTEMYAPGTNYYGRPPIIGSVKAMYGDSGRVDYNISFFRNYGLPAFAVTVTGDFADYDVDPDDSEYDVTQTLKYKITKQLKEVIKNPHSAVTITVPSEGEEGNVEVNIQPLSVDTKEASFRLYRQDNMYEIIHAHKVDPSRLGIVDSGRLNSSNSKTLDNSYKVSTIAPLKADIEETINDFLRIEFGLTDWKFTIIGSDPKDYAGDMNLLKEAWLMGAVTQNQIIKAMGDKWGGKPTNDPRMDEYYINGVPMNKIWNEIELIEHDNLLDNLGNDLMKDAEALDELYRKEESLGENGFENPISQKTDSRLTSKIQSVFDRRK